MSLFITFAIASDRELKIKYEKLDNKDIRNIKPFMLKRAKNGDIIFYNR